MSWSIKTRHGYRPAAVEEGRGGPGPRSCLQPTSSVSAGADQGCPDRLRERRNGTIVNISSIFFPGPRSFTTVGVANLRGIAKAAWEALNRLPAQGVQTLGGSTVMAGRGPGPRPHQATKRSLAQSKDEADQGGTMPANRRGEPRAANEDPARGDAHQKPGGPSQASPKAIITAVQRPQHGR